MGKLSKEEMARFQGAAWALRMVEEKGLEAAQKDLEQRGVLNIPLSVSKAQLHEFENRVRMNVLDTVLLMSVSVMLDEFEFDREMLARFIERFNQRTDCLNGNFVSWEDIQKSLQEDINVKLPLTDEILDIHKERKNA